MSKNNLQINAEIKENAEFFSSIRRNDIAHHFKGCMAKKGLKVADVAERLNVSAANISRMLNGKQNLTLDNLHALSDALEERLVLALESAWQDSNSLNINLDKFVSNSTWRVANNYEKSSISLDSYEGLPIEAANDAMPENLKWMGFNDFNFAEQRA